MENNIRQLYVLSKAIDNAPRLIGVLSELNAENCEYQFEYKLGGKFHEWFLNLEGFPDPKGVYTGYLVYAFIQKIVPEKNDKYIQKFLKAANLEKYDIWEFLKYCGRIDPHEEKYLYQQIPENAIIYDENFKKRI
jgi:hypothetical protein